MPADRSKRRLAFATVLVSALIFLAAAPFAKLQLAPMPAFIPIYESALVISDLITAVLLFGQYNILRARALLLLASAYLFTAFITIAHALSFPGVFSPTGLLGAGPQTTAWLYMFWHGGFPLLVIAYALFQADPPDANRVPARGAAAMLAWIAPALAAACVLTLLATAGHDALPAIMQRDGYTAAQMVVISSVWGLSLLALAALWRRSRHSLLDLWLMVVMCAWLFDMALAGVLNAGRYDLGWYAGRIYGLLAASFVLIVLLLENSVLHAKIVEGRENERRQAEEAIARHAERLRILHEIDGAIVAGMNAEAIAAAVLQPLRELLRVPRAIVNMIDYEAGEAEWMAAAGRHRTHVGAGVRFPMQFLGDVDALKRGEPQTIDSRALPSGAARDGLLASGVNYYMAVPMIVGGELIGALSFGGEQRLFPEDQVLIAKEVATQLAIAIAQARLLERVRRNAVALETANRQLRDSEERLNFALQRSRIGGWDLDLVDHTAHRTLQHDRTFGYNSLLPLWTYEMFLEHVLPEDRAEVDRRFRAATAAQSEWSFECRIRRVDGEVRWIWAAGEHQRDETGQARRMAGIVQDITERKRTEQEILELNASLERRVAERTQQLEASNKELEAFSYSVSHDLRAPLRAIDGYALMLAEDCGERLDDEGRRLLKVVRASAAHMGQLIDDLLKFSQVGRRPLAMMPLDMRALAREIVAEATQLYPKARVELEALPAATGDRALLRQVWSNLVGNALKYSARASSPRVEITGSSNDREVVYTVRDNGAGFEMRFYEKLFGVFQRLHREDEFEGTGVGLAIVQRVIARHGGRVWGEGAVGKGASFHFALPKES